MQWLDTLTRRAVLGAFGAALAALCALLILQTARLSSLRAEHQGVVAAVAKNEAARASAALKHELRTSAQETAHATNTQGLSDVFTDTQPSRDASLRADIARADRLRLDADRRAATYRAQANADAATRRSLADRLEALDRQLVEGVVVVGELRGVVAKRDAEVVLLRGTIDADRALLAP